VKSAASFAAVLALALPLVAGCNLLKKEADPAASASAAAPPAPVPPPPVAAYPAAVAPVAPAPPTLQDESIPAPEDFEDDAFAQVSDKTYKATLDSLKTEIGTK
jgi:hypothetical protein